MKNSGAPKSKDKENNLQLLSLIKMNESNLLSNFGVEIWRNQFIFVIFPLKIICFN